jgi:hypothetical protein
LGEERIIVFDEGIGEADALEKATTFLSLGKCDGLDINERWSLMDDGVQSLRLTEIDAG